MIKITTRCVGTAGRLRVIVGGSVVDASHTLLVPHGACPVSRNPILGLLRVRYTAARFVEVVTLRDAVLWACSGAPTAPRSVEDLAAWAAKEVAAAVNVSAVADLWLLVRPGPQVIHVRSRA